MLPRAVKRVITIVGLILCAYDGFCQQLFSAGYREVRFIDSSRRYKPTAKPGDKLFYRPVQLDIWYPSAGKPNSRPLNYAFFLSQFERRANTFQDETKYDSLASELLKHFTIGDGSQAGNLITDSYLNAVPAEGYFPLIIYLCAYNGMSYENVQLFERLAGLGYCVVSVSSVGRYPGNMTTKYPDVSEQVKDAGFAISHISAMSADTNHMAIVGYSYGGLVGLMLAAGHPCIKGFLSLDGSERHYYGRDKQEDRDFDTCRKFMLAPPRISCSYAYLESDHKGEGGLIDSVFTPGSTGANFYGRISGAEHEDFSCVSGLGNNQTPAYRETLELAVAYLDETVKGKGRSFSPELSLLASKHRVFLSPENYNNATHSIIIKGEVVEAGNNKPVPFASIGIPSGDCGTVSNNSGGFTLKVADSLTDKMLRISSIGYQPVSVPVKDIVSLFTSKRSIALKKEVRQLDVVTVRATKPQYKIVGNTSRSKFFNVGFSFRDLGSEVGVIISLGKKKVLLKTFNYHISNTRMDSCTFRLNIYSVHNGLPADNLLLQNIITGIGKNPGNYAIDLTPFNIELNGDICVSLEWIGGTTTAANGAVFFSGGLLASSYHRKTAQADWVKFKGLGAAFSLKVEEL